MGARRSNYRLKRRGLGDCLSAAQSEGICPDGSSYLGTLDSGGAASGGGTLSFPWFTGSAPSTPAPTPPSSNQSFWASIIPASFTTLQEAINQPGQVVKTPTTLIAGAGANVASVPGFSSTSNSGLLILGALAIGAVALFSFSKK
jgi:hypothetical protein